MPRPRVFSFWEERHPIRKIGKSCGGIFCVVLTLSLKLCCRHTCVLLRNQLLVIPIQQQIPGTQTKMLKMVEKKSTTSSLICLIHTASEEPVKKKANNQLTAHVWWRIRMRVCGSEGILCCIPAPSSLYPGEDPTLLHYSYAENKYRNVYVTTMQSVSCTREPIAISCRTDQIYSSMLPRLHYSRCAQHKSLGGTKHFLVWSFSTNGNELVLFQDRCWETLSLTSTLW